MLSVRPLEDLKPVPQECVPGREEDVRERESLKVLKVGFG